jgi:hypothetical protein
MSVSARMFSIKALSLRPCVVSECRKRASCTQTSQRCERRLPSSKRAVSILQLWCTLTFMHVDARLALNQLFGITEGNMAKKAKKAKAKKKTGKKKKK